MKLSSKIPCLSIRQPQAELIVRGLKSKEYRNWTTSYRGDMYVHAPLQYDIRHSDIFNIDRLETRAILGKVTLTNITQSDKPDFKYQFWLSNPIRFDKPVKNVIGNVRFFYL